MENSRNENIFRLRGDSQGRRLLFELPSGEASVGRSSENDINLAFAGVSRRHALLEIHPQGLMAEDLGSTNGTCINGVRVVRAAVGEGSRIAFGPVELTVEALDEGAELAMQFETETAVDEGSSWLDHEKADTLLTTSDETTDSEWSLIEDFASRLRTGDLSEALHRLGEVQKLEGIGLVRWTQNEEPLELESWGRLGALPLLAQIRELPALQAPDGAAWCHARLEDGVVIAHHETSGKDEITGLFLWGVNAGPIPKPFLRVLLQMCLWTLPKPIDQAVHHRIDEAQLCFPQGYVVGKSEDMKHLYRQMVEVCRLRPPVLLHGETGVGKEMLARALHDSSIGAGAPYVVVNCAAIPENLLEAEMFGVVKGAATGVEARDGHFSRAEGGTLFLDEIGELSPPLQAKLLRVLQEGEIQPVGGTSRPVDVWIIAATHVDLESGALRHDLYYRLTAGLLEIPPLRRCRDDVAPLIRHYLQLAAERTKFELRGVTSRALDKLRSYPWPGNIRELAHVAGRLVAAQPTGGILDIELLPEPLLRAEPAGEPEEALPASASLEIKPRVEALERRLIREAMIRTAGHQIRAAELLGISRSGLAKKLKRFGLEDSWARPLAAARS